MALAQPRSNRIQPLRHLPMILPEELNYPPYHSKYNGIERYWGGLERSWNGYLLDSVEGVLMRASRFVWRTARTTSTLLKGVYQKGVKLCGSEKKELEKRLSRSVELPWWDITIQPLVVNQ